MWTSILGNLTSLSKDRYRIDSQLGSGGMGVVYRAYDTILNRTVAIKVIPPQVMDEEAEERFLREARSIARLSHPNIVTIYDFEQSESLYYLILEYVEGGDLRKEMKKQVSLLPQEIAIKIARNILDALAYAHSQGVIHRDLKPENILVPADGSWRIKLTDFGLAKIIGAAKITKTVETTGTAYYLSPEQAQGKEVDGRSDLYSLGVILYEALTGYVPFTADDPVTILYRHVHQTPTPPTTINPDIPEPLERIVLKLLKKDPNDRYSSADEVLEAIRIYEKFSSSPFYITGGQMIKGRYRIEERLGGNISIVYKARDVELNRPVAIKMLQIEGDVEGGRQHFRREFRALMKLDHPNVVTVYDFEIEKGIPFFVMEYIEGVTLKQVISVMEGKLSSPEVLEIAMQICQALSYIHSQGIVHRNLESMNIMITDEGEVKVMDFGMAEVMTAEAQTNSIIRTAEYISPERGRGEHIDYRSDLYSLGVILYEMVTGRLPFEDSDPLTLIHKHISEKPAPPRQYNSELSEKEERIILKLLEKNPIDRYQSADEVLKDLSELAEGIGVETTIEIDKSLSPIKTDLIFNSPMVGRESELLALKRALGKALVGVGNMVLIKGEAGSGKTRLLDELHLHSSQRQVLFFRGSCYEREYIPYQPFAEIIKGYFEMIHLLQVDYEVTDGIDNELIKLVPELARRDFMRGLKPREELSPEQERHHIFDALYRFLAKISRSKPLILCLENLQWADEMTFSFLPYLLRNIRTDNVLICGTYRHEEVQRGHPLFELVPQLCREDNCSLISLEPLSKEATKQMIGYMLGSKDISETLVRWIYRETEGNPFFIEEMIKSCVEERIIYREDGIWKRDERRDFIIPAGIQGIVRRRINRLGEKSLDILTLASVIGQQFDFDVLQEISGEDEDELMDILEGLIRSQLIEEKRFCEAYIYNFIHSKTREVLYQDISLRKRSILHRRVGKAIEKLYPHQLKEMVEELAYHFLEGNDEKKAVYYLAKAGEKSFELFANETAIDYYKQAQERLGRLPEEDTIEYKIAIGMGLGDAYHSRGEYDKALENYEFVLKHNPQGERAAHIYRMIGWIYERRAKYEVAIEYYNKDKEELERVDQANSPQMALLYNHLGWLYIYKEDREKEWEFYKKALAILEGTDNYHELALTYNSFAMSYYMAQVDFKKAIEFANLSLEFSQKIDDISEEAKSHLAIGVAQWSLGDWSEGTIEHILQSIQLSEKIGDSNLSAIAYGALGYMKYTRGDYEEAIQYLDEMFDNAQKAGYKLLLVRYYWELGKIRKDQERWEEMVECYERLLEVAEGMESKPLLSFIYALVGEGYSKIDDHKKAKYYNDRAIALSQEAGLINIFTYMGWETEHSRLLGRVYISRGEWDKAKSHILKSIERGKEVKTPYWVGKGYYSLGLMYKEKSEFNKAVEAMNEAKEIFETLGSKVDLMVIDRFLSRMKINRRRQILDDLAQGKINADEAARLLRGR